MALILFDLVVFTSLPQKNCIASGFSTSIILTSRDVGAFKSKQAAEGATMSRTAAGQIDVKVLRCLEEQAACGIVTNPVSRR